MRQRLSLWKMTSWPSRFALLLMLPIHAAAMQVVIGKMVGFSSSSSGLRNLLYFIAVTFFPPVLLAFAIDEDDRLRAMPILIIALIEATLVVLLAHR